VKFALSLLSSLALVAGAFAQNQTVTVQGQLEGSREVIFKTPLQSCNSNDVPDAMARAFRDSTGMVHLVAASTDLFQSIGPTLDTVQRSCDAGFVSVGDPNPADFNDQIWIDSFYTFDGQNFAGLGHTEFHGWAHPGECFVTNFAAGECEYDADTYHYSTDGGYHFTTPTPPANFLAGFPYKYAIDHGPMGYSVDTNIIPWNGWFYAMTTSWPWPAGCSGHAATGGCFVQNGGGPIRTTDVFDPTSWRGWDGSDFSISFADPYLAPLTDPQDHIYTPVPFMQLVNGIYIYEPAHVVVATLWNGFDDAYGPRGFYLSTSTDLVHWSGPTLVVTLEQMLANEQPGEWQYAYFSLIDPAAPDLNFATIGNEPYLYYVRINDHNSGYRALFRQRIKLTVNGSE
jgi:hypothetical protein